MEMKMGTVRVYPNYSGDGLSFVTRIGIWLLNFRSIWKRRIGLPGHPRTLTRLFIASTSLITELAINRET
jgi:hypothetical protein